MIDATLTYPTSGIGIWSLTDSTEPSIIKYTAADCVVRDWYANNTITYNTNTAAADCVVRDWYTNNTITTYKQYNNCWETSAAGVTLNYSTWSGNNCYHHDLKRRITPGESLRNMIRQRQGPFIIGSRKPIQPTDCVKETRARETLFRVLGADKFRSFLKHGFVSVRAKSGLIYQIFPGHGITVVYDRATMVARLCVVLAGQFPPTDSIIMRYLLILNDEAEFRKLAIPHGVTQRRKVTPRSIQAERSLIEIYRELKAAA